MKPRLPILLGLLAACLSTQAQQTTTATPAETPLQAMPYSPSLDVTSMDKSVNPCENFYQYACGGWLKNNPLPADQSVWDVYAKLTQDNQRLLWGILDDSASAKNRSATQQKIGDYFSACMNTQAIDARGTEPLKAKLAAIAQLKQADLPVFLANAHLYWPGNALFDTGANQDFRDSEKMIVWIDAGGLGLPDRDYYVKTDAKSQEIRQKYVDYVAQIFGMSGEPPAQAKTDAATVMRLETSLATASLTRVDRREPHNLDHKMTVAQVSAMAPALNWPQYFSSLHLGDVQSVNMTQPEFFKALNTVIEKEPLDSLKTYLRFHAANGEANFLSSNFQQASFDFYSKYLRGIPQMRPRGSAASLK